MNEYQLEFLLTLFKNEKYPGWKSVATNLITKGNSLTTEKLWIGGIGNFIKEFDHPNCVGCVELKFNLEYFLSSEYFKERYLHKMTDLNTELHKLTNQIDKLKELKN